MRLPVSPCTDLIAIENILSGYFDDTNDDGIPSIDKQELVRLLAFGIGVVPRSLDAACAKLEEGEFELCHHLGPDIHRNGAKWYYSTSILEN